MKFATCHPERQHCAKGLCKSCYYSPRRAQAIAGGGGDVTPGQARLRALEAEMIAIDHKISELTEQREVIEWKIDKARAALAEEIKASELDVPAYFEYHAAVDRICEEHPRDPDTHDRPPGYYQAIEALGPSPSRPACLPAETTERRQYEREFRIWASNHGGRVVGVDEKSGTLVSDLDLARRPGR